MSGIGFLAGLILFLILIVMNWFMGLIPAVCMIFTILFWGSLLILVVGIVISVIAGIATRDFSCFTDILGGAFMICICGLGLALCIFLLAVILDAARLVLKVVGIDQYVSITFERLFFPWKLR